jgi:hypothetical protein
MRSGGVRWGSFAAIFWIGTFLLLQGAPAPARADSNFERGFEDQMGRILAYEAVNLGKHILVRGVLHPYPAVYYPAPAVVHPGPAVYYGGNPSYGYQPYVSYVSYGGDHHGGHHKHWKHHRGHGHGRWDHGHHDDDCDH